MSKHSLRLWPVVSVIAGVLILIVALPDGLKQGWAPSFLKPGFHLGLDLAGGTQLDFRISESEMQEQLNDIDADIAEIEAVDGSSEEKNILLVFRLMFAEGYVFCHIFTKKFVYC